MEYKNIISIVEKNFTTEDTPKASLHIVIDEQNIKIAILKDNQLQALFHFYYFKIIENWNREILESIWHENPILTQKEWLKVYVLAPLNAFTLIPKDLFETQETANYLQFAAHFDTQNAVFANPQQYFEAINIFDLNKDIFVWANQRFPKVAFASTSEVFLNFIGNLKEEQTDLPKIHVLVNNKSMIISVLAGNQVFFCNAFSFKTAQDFLYFVVLVIDQLRLDKTTTEVILYGQITQVAEIYRLLNNFVAKLSIWQGQLQDFIISQTFEAIPKVQYIDVWSLCKKSFQTDNSSF